MTARNRNVLISGASVAGPTLAYWLARHGFRPVVVERAAGPREGGYPIDVIGPATEVARRMGVLPRVRQARVEMKGLSFVDRSGRSRARVATGRFAAPGIELPRGDLVRILYEATADDVEYVFGDSVSTLEQDGDGVNVTFERGGARRFDLVVGADGLHSLTRALAMGEERRFLRHLDHYVAAADVSKDMGVDDEVLLYNEPGRMAGVYSYLDRATAIFVFRHPELDGADRRDAALHGRVLTEAFAGDGWRVPELLARVTAAPDFYFDSVSQIRMDRWSAGRVTLAGDAAHCPALLSGHGTTLAMTGAYVLAGELYAAGGDYRTAFARYEERHRGAVERGQAKIAEGAGRLVPGSASAIRTRNLLSRFWMLPAVASRIGSLLPRRAPVLDDYGSGVPATPPAARPA
ncbi:FAD-dependent monooxygenase [Streptosporangium sp. DT93]|uniref:FAD-dependent monooxygenase n=1 Tax=Streptosporangium sp. DT93 TaxID=3393428 RepID=UPI003CFA8850